MDIKYIVVHCSATPPSLDIGAREIKKWHLKRDFKDIGYHYVIRRNGKIEKGRRDDVPGAHAKGFNNVSLGICLVGGVDSYNRAESNYTRSQYAALEELLSALAFKNPKAEILGHRDLPAVKKECPCFNVREFWG